MHDSKSSQSVVIPLLLMLLASIALACNKTETIFASSKDNDGNNGSPANIAADANSESNPDLRASVDGDEAPGSWDGAARVDGEDESSSRNASDTSLTPETSESTLDTSKADSLDAIRTAPSDDGSTSESGSQPADGIDSSSDRYPGPCTVTEKNASGDIVEFAEMTYENRKLQRYVVEDGSETFCLKVAERNAEGRIKLMIQSPGACSAGNSVRTEHEFEYREDENLAEVISRAIDSGRTITHTLYVYNRGRTTTLLTGSNRTQIAVHSRISPDTLPEVIEKTATDGRVQNVTYEYENGSRDIYSIDYNDQNKLSKVEVDTGADGTVDQTFNHSYNSEGYYKEMTWSGRTLTVDYSCWG